MPIARPMTEPEALRMQQGRWQTLAVAALLSAVLAACGGSDGEGGTSADAASTQGAVTAVDATPSASPSPTALAEDVGASGEPLRELPAGPTVGGWTRMANERSNFTVPANTLVRYGANGIYVTRTVSGAAACTNVFFGSDPLRGVTKACDARLGLGGTSTAAPASPAMTQRDAVRLADQGTFGPTEALVASMRQRGANGWIADQMLMNGSRYSSGGNSSVHQHTAVTEFCAGRTDNCWRDNFSTEPLLWDFYRNATTRPDQLRQRVAFALSQIVVVNNLEVSGTYGFRNYHNMLLRESFGNYRQVLKKVALSPVMGAFLNNVNNDKNAPNENFARELLQLFTIGTCELNGDGTLRGGRCTATYNNENVRAYAYALTGWTFPAGGRTSYGCWPTGANCRYYGADGTDGDMVPVPRYRDAEARTLINGHSVAANTTAEQALERVLDSVMTHPNMAPFIGRQLIQHLVSSNPSPAYVSRVSSAFISGRYQNFGTGQRGDLSATIAAILLDSEARGDAVARTAGKLREPVLMFTGVLRGLNGASDGDALSWWWGGALRQHVFRAPSVFNFYPPDFPIAGTTLVGPTFGIHNADAALARLNFLTYLLDWNGSTPRSYLPNPIGTQVNLTAFAADADDASVLVDRLSNLALGRTLPTTARDEVIRATSWWTASRDATNWRTNRVKSAAFLIYGSPHYQIQR